MDYEMILDKTADIFIHCNINSFPINCFEILNTYGFQLISYAEIKSQLPLLYNMCRSYSSDAFQHKKVIYYNEKNIINRIRFTLMHELGHYVLGHTNSSEEIENEADYFASNILAPRIVIHHEQLITSDKIHDRFGLSYTASNRVLSDYKKNYCPTTKKLQNHFYPNPMWQLPKPKASKKKNSKLEEHLNFQNELRIMYGDEFLFHQAENDWLYGF